VAAAFEQAIPIGSAELILERVFAVVQIDHQRNWPVAFVLDFEVVLAASARRDFTLAHRRLDVDIWQQGNIDRLRLHRPARSIGNSDDLKCMPAGATKVAARRSEDHHGLAGGAPNIAGLQIDLLRAERYPLGPWAKHARLRNRVAADRRTGL